MTGATAAAPLRILSCRLIGLEDDRGCREPIGETAVTVERFVPRVVFVHGNCFVLFARTGHGAGETLIYAQERPFYADANFKPRARS